MDWLAYGLPVGGEQDNQARVGSVMQTEVMTCRLGDPLGEVAAAAAARNTDLCAVLNEAGVIMGVLRSQRLAGDPAQTAEQAMRPGPSTFRPSVPIEEMIEFLASRDIQGPALVGTPDGRLLGTVTLKTLREAAKQP